MYVLVIIVEVLLCCFFYRVICYNCKYCCGGNCSYGLFKMFDDVMFLVKGGCIVYLGFVSEVEDYFVGIGLVVLEWINLFDYYMDVLEGIVVFLD